MRTALYVLTTWLLLSPPMVFAAKPKVISFGRWMPVKWMVGANADVSIDLKVRPLLVNGEVKEYTTGDPHDVTDRIFAVRTAYRINDILPGDGRSVPKWRWQPGGWVLVNRPNAHISKLALPEFDPDYSAVSWYGDYAAYCGMSDSADKLYAVVAQVGRRKPVLKKFIGAVKSGELPESECEPPKWQKQPVRVTFRPKAAGSITFSIYGHATDLMAEEPADEADTE